MVNKIFLHENALHMDHTELNSVQEEQIFPGELFVKTHLKAWRYDDQYGKKLLSWRSIYGTFIVLETKRFREIEWSETVGQRNCVTEEGIFWGGNSMTLNKNTTKFGAYLQVLKIMFSDGSIVWTSPTNRQEIIEK